MRRRAFGWPCIVVVATSITWLAGREMSARQLEEKKQSESDLEKLNQQFVETSLKLTELDLEILENANRNSNTFPKASVDKMRQIVVVAKWRAEEARKGLETTEYENYSAIAEGEMKIAELQYRSSLAAQKQFANAVPTLGLERLKLTSDLARLRYERVQAAKNQPPLLLVRWQLQDLRDEIRRVSQRVELYRGNQ